MQSGPLGTVLAALLVRDAAARPDAEQLDRLLAAAEAGAEPTAEAVRASMDTARLNSTNTLRLSTRTDAPSPTRLEDERPQRLEDERPQADRPQPVRGPARRTAIWSSWLAAAVLATAVGWTVNHRSSEADPSDYRPAAASPSTRA